MNEELTSADCKICYESFSDEAYHIPLTIKSCGHIVCSDCLGSMFRKAILENKKSLFCPTCRSENVLIGNILLENFPKNTDFMNMVIERKQMVIDNQKIKNATRRSEQDVFLETLPFCQNHKNEKAEFVCVDNQCPREEKSFCFICCNIFHKSCARSVKLFKFGNQVKIETHKQKFDRFFEEQENLVKHNCKKLEGRLLCFLNAFRKKREEIEKTYPEISFEKYHPVKQEFKVSRKSSQDGNIILDCKEIEDFGEILEDLSFGFSENVLWKNISIAEKSTLALHSRKYFQYFGNRNEKEDDREIFQRLENTNKFLLQNFFLRDLQFDEIATSEEFANKIRDCFEFENLRKKKVVTLQACGFGDLRLVEQIVQKELFSAICISDLLGNVEKAVGEVFVGENCQWTCVCEPGNCFPKGEVIKYQQISIGGFRVSVWGIKS